MNHPPPVPSPSDIDDLSLGEQFLLWSVRTWARAHGSDRENAHYYLDLLRSTFEKAKMHEGPQALDRFLTTLLYSQERAFRAHYPNCGRLSEDEVLLLAIVGEAQRERRRETSIRLAELVGEKRVGDVLEASLDIALKMTRKGLFCRTFIYSADASSAERSEPCPHRRVSDMVH